MDTDMRDAVEAGFVEAYSDHQEALLRDKAKGPLGAVQRVKVGMAEACPGDRKDTGPEPRASQGAVVMNLCHVCKTTPAALEGLPTLRGPLCNMLPKA